MVLDFCCVWLGGYVQFKDNNGIVCWFNSWKLNKFLYPLFCIRMFSKYFNIPIEMCFSASFKHLLGPCQKQLTKLQAKIYTHQSYYIIKMFLFLKKSILCIILLQLLHSPSVKTSMVVPVEKLWNLIPLDN